ncbi:AraC family transcriptional regulator [Williamsia sterculiae]|uniref:Transcriptional regulator, AraC family n=1 Tax=Williamsia sterculiae TaxID=1344003 RepID=A0A1N7GXL4_9NOCA|nr:AraC family transcriptional regulator [Williamsia sterculiae]SIS17333.1 transcriptional regulator, AraC family [Williamsia sterculiae]
MDEESDVRAWRPAVKGIEEVFHARFVDYAYPRHTHDSWTLLIVDSGAISYDLDGREHGAMQQVVTVLPPHVPHDGRAVTASGFRKRVLYLERSMLDGVGSAVDTPALRDARLRDRVHALHSALARPGDELEAQSRLAFILERTQQHLRNSVGESVGCVDSSLARSLRDLIDSRIPIGVTLDQAAAVLHAEQTHLVRSFSREFGIAPHRYLISRRVQLARKMLLCGQSPAAVATAVGFHDQSHLNRHFTRLVGTTPARFARLTPRSG